jgi:hypothetical protein
VVRGVPGTPVAATAVPGGPGPSRPRVHLGNGIPGEVRMAAGGRPRRLAARGVPDTRDDPRARSRAGPLAPLRTRPAPPAGR